MNVIKYNYQLNASRSQGGSLFTNKIEGGEIMHVKFRMSMEHYFQLMKALQYASEIHKGDWNCLIGLMKESKMVSEDIDEKRLMNLLQKMKKTLVLDKYLNEYFQINEKHNLEEAEILKLLNQRIESSKMMRNNDCVEFEIDMTDLEIESFKRALDIITRFQLGQWDEIIQFIYPACGSSMFASDEQRKYIGSIRKEICPVFSDISSTSSFGIYNGLVSNNARIIYDLYKVFMCETGAGGVYKYKPKSASGLLLPIVEAE